MYLWKLDSLIDELRNGTISQSVRFKYFLVFLVFTALIMEISLFISESPSAVSFSQSSFVVLITIFGTIWCYQINKKGDNREFADRFICLFLPVFLRIFLLFILMYSLYMLQGMAFFGDSFDKFTEETNWIDVGFTVYFELYFYRKMANAINRVANKSLEQTGTTCAGLS